MGISPALRKLNDWEGQLVMADIGGRKHLEVVHSVKLSQAQELWFYQPKYPE